MHADCVQSRRSNYRVSFTASGHRAARFAPQSPYGAVQQLQRIGQSRYNLIIMLTLQKLVRRDIMSNHSILFGFGKTSFVVIYYLIDDWGSMGSSMGVNPYGTEVTRPPNILVGGDSNDNFPPNN